MQEDLKCSEFFQLAQCLKRIVLEYEHNYPRLLSETPLKQVHLYFTWYDAFQASNINLQRGSLGKYDNLHQNDKDVLHERIVTCALVK